MTQHTAGPWTAKTSVIQDGGGGKSYFEISEVADMILLRRKIWDALIDIDEIAGMEMVSVSDNKIRVDVELEAGDSKEQAMLVALENMKSYIDAMCQNNETASHILFDGDGLCDQVREAITAATA